MTDKKKIIIGSRGSKLSLAYSNHVKELLIKSNSKFEANSIEIKIIKTSGDIHQSKKISEIGGKGVFSKQIEEELLDSKIDIAVHSLKDLPTLMTEGLCVSAVVKRNDPRDAFLSYSNKSFFELESNSKIGTSSFRRKAQLNLLRNDIEIIDMRGNIDTRISKLKNKDFDAIVLALAGVEMLNLKSEIKEVFTTEQMLPAIGQGAIALQCKKKDKDTLNVLKTINDKETYYCIQAERALLEAIGGDCDTAVGGLAKLSDENIFLKSELFSNDGKKKFESQSSGHFKDAKEIGYKVGKELLKKAGSNFTTQEIKK
jgi:hydroxymethylbilane synthase